ncbi:MAG: Hsp70 family protein, partial [Candidatus Cloacimonadota bacterium]|nr:Hsp70 family protein [Candidatus Cloacimonadota bacterium]
EDFKNKAAQQYHNHIDSIEVSGENACTRFLEFIRSESEKKIGLGSISNAVITVPANFNNAEIEAIKRAGEKAGFVNISIVKEPTAAAIAYGFDVEENKKILVYDFGGGTFDVSIIESRNNVFEVLTTGGDSELGGEDLTRALIDEVYDQLYEKLDLDMYSLKDSGLEQDEYRHNLREISTAAELTKVHLSAFEEDTIDISLYVGDGEEQSLNLPISRVDFENLVRDKIKKTLDILDNTFMATDFKVDDIDIVVLAGGSSLMPIIQDRIEKYFGRVPNSEKDTATVISQGAAIVANSEWGRPEDGIKKKIQYFENTVADFGVKIKGKLFDCLIEKRTELPVRVEKEYTPATNNQESLRIEVYSRGDEYLNSKRVFDKGVEYIDEILISNLPPMDIDQTSIKVFFELTKEDILHVDVEIYDISRDNELINTKNLEITKSSRFH